MTSPTKKKEKAIIFVESPGKCPTIRKYLSMNKEVEYDVVATFGHIQQLPSKQGSVKVEEGKEKEKINFIWESKGETVKKLIKNIKENNYNNFYIATDPDREGEGIAYHVWNLLIENNCDLEKIHRISFNEITKSAIEAGLKKPGKINKNLVNAYLSRLAVDYLIGYGLSPLAWRLGSNYSVGRVQTSGLKIIVEREEEIFNFIETVFYVLYGIFDQLDLFPKIIKFKEEEIGKIIGEEKVEEIIKEIENKKEDHYEIIKIIEKDIKKNPSAPFSTSTLQQEAALKLGFSVSVTMSNAQKLYEEGLITYMRTDSTNISKEAVEAVRKYIPEEFGEEYLSEEILTYNTKIKNAQEAHEAVRPTDINNKGDFIENEYYKKLYQLIWKRTVACQMSSAIYKKKEIILKNSICEMSLNGSQLKFLGYLKVYGREEDEEDLLPDLPLNKKFQLKEINKETNKTKHPPRYTEGGLVKTLEKKGIGRPSTYGLIIEIIKKREYVRIFNKSIFGLMKGKILIGYLEVFLSKYVDYNFTAQMEESLDKIANGELNWDSFLLDFYKSLEKDIQKAKAVELFPMLDQINPTLQKWIKQAKCDKCNSSYNLYRKSNLYFCCSRCKKTMPLKDNFDLQWDKKNQEGEGEEKEKYTYSKKYSKKKTTSKKKETKPTVEKSIKKKTSSKKETE